MNNRVIKFRVWEVNTKRFVEKTYGGLGWPDESEIKIKLDGNLEIEAEYGERILNSKNYVVQQFIGLKDKNNKEIYEGDIVNIQGEIKEVEEWFEIGGWGVKSLLFSELNGDIEVVGNIFENTELLAAK